MFREIVRFKQAMEKEACLALLKEAKRGFLSVITEDGYPYVLPINHYYDEAGGRIFFHSGHIGHKLDCIKACDKASFAVIDEGRREGDDWPLHFESVIVFGRIRVIEDHEEVLRLSRALSRKFIDNEAEIEEEVKRSGFRTVGLELIPEHMTGKRVKES